MIAPTKLKEVNNCHDYYQVSAGDFECRIELYMHVMMYFFYYVLITLFNYDVQSKYIFFRKSVT